MPMAKILDGKAVAAEVRAEVAAGVTELKARGVPVRLDVILVGEDPASTTYVAMKQRDSAEVGMDSRDHRFPDDVSQEELAALVEELNGDQVVSGFFIQDRKSTRLNSSHANISYAVFCLKKKKITHTKSGPIPHP